jgi:electron transfer flavoprotein alpha subunit
MPATPLQPFSRRIRKKVITVRGTAFEKAATEAGSGEIEPDRRTGDAGLSSFVGQEVAHSERPELTSANIIVRGAVLWALRTSSTR